MRMGTKNKENKRINEEKKRKKKKLRADGESTSRRQATNQIRIPADRGRGGPSHFRAVPCCQLNGLHGPHTHTHSQEGTGGLIK